MVKKPSRKTRAAKAPTKKRPAKKAMTKKAARKPVAKKSPVKKATARKAAPRKTRAAHLAVATINASLDMLHGRATTRGQPHTMLRKVGGSWMICFLQEDGSYAECQPYNGPLPTMG